MKEVISLHLTRRHMKLFEYHLVDGAWVPLRLAAAKKWQTILRCSSMAQPSMVFAERVIFKTWFFSFVFVFFLYFKKSDEIAVHENTGPTCENKKVHLVRLTLSTHKSIIAYARCAIIPTFRFASCWSKTCEKKAALLSDDILTNTSWGSWDPFGSRNTLTSKQRILFLSRRK